MSDFYVGYAPKAPAALMRALRRMVIALFGSAVAIAVSLVLGQQPFAASRFEFLQNRDYQGVVSLRPHPRLLTEQGSFLLVGPGKHGAGDSLNGLDLWPVRLRGALIQRNHHRMLELVPGSVQATGRTGAAPETIHLGEVTLHGEIVDSKCFLGVMNPGNGKVHRGCAVRCISGGIPPAFVARDAAGASRTMLLTGVASREILDFVAEPVTIRGRLSRSLDILFLEVDRSGNKPAVSRY
jgi:hypothetical protein